MEGGIFIKFIFPKNFNFKNKLFGVIDYSTIFLNLIWFGFIFIIIHLFFRSLIIKIVLFILFCFPFLLISISGFNGENFLYVFRYMLSFSLKQKLYFYSKKSRN